MILTDVIMENQNFYYGYSDFPNEHHSIIATSDTGATFFVRCRNLPTTYIFNTGQGMPDCALSYEMEQENYHSDLRILNAIINGSQRKYCYIRAMDASQDDIKVEPDSPV
jgi:hypothetical protein